MVLATEQPQQLGNAFQLFASAAIPLEKQGEASHSEEEFEMVENASISVIEATINPTGAASKPSMSNPPVDDYVQNELQTLRQQIGKHRAENIQLDIQAGQLQREKEDLSVELSRVRMALAREKTESSKRKKKYEDLLEECQMGSDKLSKRLVKHRRRADGLEAQLKSELADQKLFWQEINQQLHKEAEHSLTEISGLTEQLEDHAARRQEDRAEAKLSEKKLSTKLEDALQETARLQIQLERLELDNGRLRKEKTELEINCQDRISRVNTITPVPEDAFSNEDMLRMMNETMGIQEDDDFEASCD